mmetsp:Transcript_10890/g.12564  ORF Transcript_10890/g.12564 Transcript_10890/m.12564 type:complete len:274 (+) Transcript_10890:387-1208(+)|eukprot:CAMPEP_0184028068 /NCGR_PEP_ID=MMETSP0954-20121128/14589_1 /TAXON_ID=627963 /ORGANISM="Aplanochytrium sp, Strain PBS07" /LENGTH=273 /DNA_ID=CAMNT_0026312779 /DNA_START=387 /DNA_END=1208 /DNA_ORIENTATION=+
MKQLLSKESQPSSEAENTSVNNESLQTLEGAQVAFKNTVSKELQKLETAGETHYTAVKTLLKRITQTSTISLPPRNEIERVKKKYGVVEENAIHALVVKKELQMLKRNGLDMLAAVEELTLRLGRPNTDAEERILEINIKEESLARNRNEALKLPLGPFTGGGRKRRLGDESSATAVLKRLKNFVVEDSKVSEKEESEVENVEIAKKEEKTVDTIEVPKKEENKAETLEVSKKKQGDSLPDPMPLNQGRKRSLRTAKTIGRAPSQKRGRKTKN